MELGGSELILLVTLIITLRSTDDINLQIDYHPDDETIKLITSYTHQRCFNLQPLLPVCAHTHIYICVLLHNIRVLTSVLQQLLEKKLMSPDGFLIVYIKNAFKTASKQQSTYYRMEDIIICRYSHAHDNFLWI